MYLTFYKKLQKEEYTIFDYLNKKPYEDTIIYRKMTLEVKYNPRTFDSNRFNIYIEILKALASKYQNRDLNQEYTTFYIPKHSGGLRQINAPKEELMQDLKDFKTVISQNIKVLEHNAAYAYVTNRNCKAALEVHQTNKSRWFLKLDIKKFFPSCTPEFTVKMLHQIFPFNNCTEETLHDIFSICFKDNGLPQGTPTSPLLTNLLMVPIDYEIQKYANQHHLIYTRYADDLLISSKYSFNWKDVQKEIKKIFKKFEAPFTLNSEKTRYGSNAGRNWNLGLMYNKDHNITIGANKKRYFKAMLNNFCRDFSNHHYWSRDDVYKLNGIISYYKSIEPTYIKHLITKYEEQYSVNLKAAFKYILNA